MIVCSVILIFISKGCDWGARAPLYSLCYTPALLYFSVIGSFLFFLGGRHAMALTVDGKVFSWGEGDDGKLGHFSRM